MTMPLQCCCGNKFVTLVCCSDDVILGIGIGIGYWYRWRPIVLGIGYASWYRSNPTKQAYKQQALRHEVDPTLIRRRVVLFVFKIRDYRIHTESE